MQNEVWVLGATGRTGRAIARRLQEAGVPLVLVGRDRERLAAVGAELGGAPRLLVGTLDAALAALAQDAPAVVVNTIGPFTATALAVARACPPGTHYVDVANELPAVEAILALNEEAKETGRVFVTGAGFGVLATESVALRLCDGQPPALRVRVDAIPSVAIDSGVVGSALIGSIVGGLPDGGRQIRHGRLTRARLGSDAIRLTTPDGDTVTTASLPSGELLAAWRASGADALVAASSAVPTGAAARLLIPVASALLRIPAIAGFAVSRLARVAVKAQDRPRVSSWAHARAEWPSGASREGWLRAGGDAMVFTAATTAEVAQRLLNGEGRPGAHTPGALFGPELAEAGGGEFIIDGVTAGMKGGDPMPTNTAAWLSKKGDRLAIKPAPYTHPRPNEIVVKNHAVAINPLDWIIQVAGNVAYRWLRYPFILGSDLAGEVVEVGAAVTRFKVGDRVLGHAVGTDKDSNNPAEGAFQEYTVLLAHMASPIPDTMLYANAAVLPLGLSTAACGLFQQDQLALRYPSATPQPTGETLLVWGGSTSVGSNAIQLAVAAGYEVITTASPRNFDYVRSLGASQVFDYASPTAVPEIIAAFRGKRLAGALAVGAGSAEPCAEIVHASNGNKFIAMASPAVSFASGLSFPVLRKLIVSAVSLQVRCGIRRIRTKFIIGTTLKQNEVGTLIYEQFLPQALAEGRYLAAPEPHVVGNGLDSIQTGFDMQRTGVSATKVVITL